jgi:AmiR/NasT family two-component response regulator
VFPRATAHSHNDLVSGANQRVSEFEQLARAFRAAPDEDARLQLAVDSAVKLVETCDHAGITISEKGGLLTRVGSDDMVRRANELQYEVGEGPCLSVRQDQDTIVVTDLAAEDRWPTWASQVHQQFGATSMMSLLVYTDRDSFGALSLYAMDGKHFDPDDIAVAQALAGHLALSMSVEREIDQLKMAIISRLVIGRAEGILMERLDITADQAFDYLRRISSDTNRKLVAIASDIARTRTLPSD